MVGCGRTDTGVHASDFYAHADFDFQSPLLEDVGEALRQLVFKLNNLLPMDIVVYDIFPVAADAHARFDAVARTYQYHVSDRRLPFRQGQYCRIYYRPDLERMNEAARVLMEYDDFTSFAKLHTQVKTNICHLSEAHWDTLGEEWVFTIRSNRFLRNMVRSVTGTLLDVGRGKLTIDGLREIPENRPIRRRTFASVEPIQRQPDADMIDAIAQTNWVIIGAETGRRKGKVIPKKSWIDAIIERCSAEMIPVFMKESLRFIMGDDFKQEYPWEV